MNKQELEEGKTFTPRFNADGLIPCITTSARTGKVLMLAYMNAESLQKTIETGEAHYYSRSRQELWHKGATSGNIQRVVKISTDCDQDAILLSVDMPAQGSSEISCHTNRETCFYREIIVDLDKKTTLKFK